MNQKDKLGRMVHKLHHQKGTEPLAIIGNNISYLHKLQHGKIIKGHKLNRAARMVANTLYVHVNTATGGPDADTPESEYANSLADATKLCECGGQDNNPIFCGLCRGHKNTNQPSTARGRCKVCSTVLLDRRGLSVCNLCRARWLLATRGTILRLKQLSRQTPLVDSQTLENDKNTMRKRAATKMTMVEPHTQLMPPTIIYPTEITEEAEANTGINYDARKRMHKRRRKK